jgi:hypothetical protein
MTLGRELATSFYSYALARATSEFTPYRYFFLSSVIPHELTHGSFVAFFCYTDTFFGDGAIAKLPFLEQT